MSMAIVAAQAQAVKKITQDEMWYEAERRGCYVPPDDPVIRRRVSDVILRVGEDLRKSTLSVMRKNGFGSASDRTCEGCSSLGKCKGCLVCAKLHDIEINPENRPIACIERGLKE